MFELVARTPKLALFAWRSMCLQCIMGWCFLCMKGNTFPIWRIASHINEQPTLKTYKSPENWWLEDVSFPFHFLLKWSLVSGYVTPPKTNMTLGKSSFAIGNTSSTGLFSIAMLVYQRVCSFFGGLGNMFEHFCRFGRSICLHLLVLGPWRRSVPWHQPGGDVDFWRMLWVIQKSTC